MRCNYCGRSLGDDDEFLVIIVNLKDYKGTVTVCRKCFEKIFVKIDEIKKSD